MCKKYLNGFLHLPYITKNRLTKIISLFDSDFEKAWFSSSQWIQFFKQQHQAKVIKFLNSFEIEKEYRYLQKNGIQLVERQEKTFPQLLNEIPDRPIGLYVKGTIPQTTHQLSIVGTRKMNAYGKTAINTILGSLEYQDLTIVSGMAYGVDEYVHEIALRQSIPTLAIIGSGLDYITPRGLVLLSDKILSSGGAIISEYPPKTIPSKYHYPERNRLIAGYASHTLVIQAPIKSGAMITAELALDYNREVGAVPGSIESDIQKGCHKLIKEGARMVESQEDLLEWIGITDNEKSASLQLPRNELEIYQQLDSPKYLDELRSSAKSDSIFTILIQLEQKKLIQKDLLGRFHRI